MYRKGPFAYAANTGTHRTFRRTHLRDPAAGRRRRARAAGVLRRGAAVAARARPGGRAARRAPFGRFYRRRLAGRGGAAAAVCRRPAARGAARGRLWGRRPGRCADTTADGGALYPAAAVFTCRTAAGHRALRKLPCVGRAAAGRRPGRLRRPLRAVPGRRADAARRAALQRGAAAGVLGPGAGALARTAALLPPGRPRPAPPAGTRLRGGGFPVGRRGPGAGAARRRLNFARPMQKAGAPFGAPAICFVRECGGNGNVFAAGSVPTEPHSCGGRERPPYNARYTPSKPGTSQ